MRYLIGLFICVVSLFFVSPVFASSNVIECPELLKKGNVCGAEANDFGQIVANVLQLLLIAAILVAFVFLIWGGIKWIISNGDKSKVDSARGTIIGALVGLVFCFLAFLIISFVGRLFGINLQSIELPQDILRKNQEKAKAPPKTVGSEAVAVQTQHVQDVPIRDIAGKILPTIDPRHKGLQGIYYNNNNFIAPVIIRNDQNVNFHWGSDSPARGVSPDTFSVVWMGYVVPMYNETYTFYAKADDSILLRVNGRELVNTRGQNTVAEKSGQIKLRAWQKYSIQIEYVQNYDEAIAEVKWSSASQEKEVIPQNSLFVGIDKNDIN